MKLTRKNQQKLLSFFPPIELSYIKNIHKKVHSDMYLIIPKGYKFFAWFKCWNNQNVCFIMQVDTRTKSISSIQIYPCVFNYKLCAGKGTICYGTMIKNNINIFCIEDIYYFMGKNINFVNFKKKLSYLDTMFSKYLKQVAYKKNDIVFGLPVMSNNYNIIINQIQNINYEIYCIQMRKLNRNSGYLNYKLKIQPKLYGVFEVKTCIDEDIYELFFKDKNSIVKHNYAFIPDYKTSIYMNSLFRNIRENTNLDYIEESEDEETFENISLDKYVNLNKKIKMMCEYNHKMKLWKPLKISDQDISSKKYIYSIEKK
tara:strand:+ start:420 stop:1361 length:942 start_codon:yes stop_codon:yes gene_type:complete